MLILLLVLGLIVEVIVGVIASIPMGWVLMTALNIFITELQLTLPSVDYGSGYLICLWLYFVFVAIKFISGLSGGVGSLIIGDD